MVNAPKDITEKPARSAKGTNRLDLCVAWKWIESSLE